ncbi:MULTISPECIES: hypothetical protein [unclassified Leptolyngbya]|uniref:hypothetical protein n=1 Tax=unclassified Leptolyngbya TaxID=2650499 RepID=UPI001687B87A|nr:MULTISPECIES: hypothetical protein [unclassified Leptolyngbya]MBD1913014.1 hypothetical protein [Leptolyngbya sp. FACHB-8]MBD2153428.1 hypothetical protein [Leptolyngbya sp. FACHB-16]
MTVKQSQYEELLAEYCDHQGAIALLKQYRSYLEMVPSMRRPSDSVITIPLPVVRVRHTNLAGDGGVATVKTSETVLLPCDVGILMCDPEWKIKTGSEIFVFIHRPQEDFSDLLSRWRHTQMLLNRDYEWVMPHRYKHILNEAAEDTYPLFVIFPDTPERIRRGLRGAGLPFVIQQVDVADAEEPELIEEADDLSYLPLSDDTWGEIGEGF